MFKIVKEAIDELNPFGLLPEAPNDEFDSESRKIAAQINDNSTIEEIAEIISKVLSKAFDEKFEIEACKVTAGKIHKSMSQSHHMKFNG